MPASMVLAAAAVILSIPVLGWALAGNRNPGAAAVSRNLSLGRAAVTDLRQTLLEQSTRDRAFRPAVAALSHRARRLTPAAVVDRLEHRLVLAGSNEKAIERLLAAKLAGAIGGLMFGLLQLSKGFGAVPMLLAAVVVVGSWTLPDIVLLRRARERQARIQRSLPDVLDQITIAVEAGLGFDAALARVAAVGAGPLAVEIARGLQDVRLGIPRREALHKLLDRTDVADLRAFVHAVVQAEGYGVPVAQVLRVQSGELREKRRQRAEEQAMKVPVKIIFPLVFCILPTLFVVVLGPALVRLTRTGLG